MQEYQAKAIHLAENTTQQLSSGAYYSVILVSRGTARFRWEGVTWSCGTEDLMLMCPGAELCAQNSASKNTLDLQWVRLSPELLARLSTPEEDLLAGFEQQIQPRQQARATCEMAMLTKSLAYRMASLGREAPAFGSSLFAQSLLTMFAVLVVRCVQLDERRGTGGRRHLMMDELFIFIREHISEEITLERLEREFYISRCHIAREFKRQTGQTVHQYITKAKLDLCCEYIEQGRPITEVYKLCGFGSYNHFFRVFKQYYGMTPKEYFRANQ